MLEPIEDSLILDSLDEIIEKIQKHGYSALELKIIKKEIIRIMQERDDYKLKASRDAV